MTANKTQQVALRGKQNGSDICPTPAGSRPGSAHQLFQFALRTREGRGGVRKSLSALRSRKQGHDSCRERTTRFLVEPTTGSGSKTPRSPSPAENVHCFARKKLCRAAVLGRYFSRQSDHRVCRAHGQYPTPAHLSITRTVIT